MPKAQKKNKSNTPQALIIIIVMAALVVLAIYFGTGVFNNEFGSPTVNMDLPVIKTGFVQPSTGEEYNVQTLFSVKLDRAASREVSYTELTEALTEIMLEMDIEKILGVGKVDYISTTATTKLNDYLAEREITTRVLVVGFASSDNITLTGPENNERSDDVMRGLFQGID